MVSRGTYIGSYRGAHPQFGCAPIIRIASFNLRHHSDRQVPVFRNAGIVTRPDLGILRHLKPWARGIFLTRRICDGHVSDAADWSPGRIRRPCTAGLHGVFELEVAALVLVRFQSPPVRTRHDGGRARPAGAGLRLVCLPLARHRRVLLHHHAGAHVRFDAGVFPQRYGLWRQQRLHGFQRHPGFRPAFRQNPRGAAGNHRRRIWRPAIWRAA